MRYKILSVFAALAAITACGDLTSINQNPNGPVDVPPPSILPSVIQGVVGGVNGVDALNIRGGGLWVQYYAEIQYRDEDKYIVRSGTSGGWGFYNGALEDAQRMINKGQTSSAPNWSAVGRIMKSYIYSVMTDAMGDIPYSQALKGDTVLHPTYDTQQAIYNALFTDLAQANTDIDLAPSAVGFADGDLMYGGNMARWKKFANSLRLRLAIHLSKADPTKGASEAAAAIAAGVFTSNADNAQLMYLSTSPNRNPIYNDAQGRDDYGMSKTFVDSLTSFADPRLPVFAQLNKDTIVANRTYQGLPNGLNDGEGVPLFYISRFGAYWRSTAAAPMHLLTYSEVLFLEAEAAERGWIPGGSAAAATYYTNAITASLQQYGIGATAIATYLGQARVGYDAGGTTLAAHMNQIMYQKWVSLFMQGMEAWTEVRRTGIPSLIPGPRAVFGAGIAGNIPQRLPYDDNEAVLNAANLNAAVTAQGFSAGNDIQAKLWFAK
jgi:SusD/RagB-like outer membrane lipoprotein